MASIAQIRRDYPQYRDLSDRQIADALHARYYEDVPLDTFYKRVGVAAPGDNDDSLLGSFGRAVGEGAASLGEDIGGLATRVLGSDAGLGAWSKARSAALRAGRSQADVADDAAQAERERVAAGTKPGLLARGLGALGEAYDEPVGPLSTLAKALLPADAQAAMVQGAQVTAPLQSVRAATRFAGRQIPSTAASLIPGSVGARLGLGATGATRLALGTGAALNSASAARQASDTVRASGGSEEQAQAAYDKALAIALATSAAAARMPSLERQIFAEPTMAGSRIARAVKGAGKAAVAEAPQEFVEEAGSQVGVNVGTGAPLGENVLSSGALGALAGAGTGALLGGANAGLRAPVTEETPDVEAPSPAEAETVPVAPPPEAPPMAEQAVAPVETDIVEPIAPSVRERLVAVAGPKPDVKSQELVERLSAAFNDDLAAGDPDSTADYIDEQRGMLDGLRGSPATKARRAAVLDEAERALGEYRSMAMADETPIPTLTAPVGDGTSRAPVVAQTAEDVARAAEQVAEPTEAQKSSGTYRKGHVKVQGLDIAIENPKGSERSGTDPNGEPWSVTMPDHYGYVKRTEGADGDAVDVYIGPDPQAPTVFVVDQADADTGAFDEHKAMIGYPDQQSAVDAYNAAFSDGRGPDRTRAVTPMAMDDFKAWLKQGDTKAPAAESDELIPPAPMEGPGVPDATSVLAGADEIPVADGPDYRPAATLSDARSMAHDFIGKPLRNDATGLVATVSKNNLGKMTSTKAVQKSTSEADHAAAVANVDRLFAKAEIGESHPDAKGTTTIAAIHRYYVPMETPDGRTVNVKMTVKETTGSNEPNPLYTVETLEVEPPSVSKTYAMDQGPHASPGGSDSNIGGDGGNGNPPSAGGEPPSRRTPKALAARLKPTLDRMAATFRFRYSGAVPGSDIPMANALGVSPDELSDTQSLTRSLELLDSSTAGRLQQLERKYFNPILDAIARLNVDPQDAGMFLLARAAPDRNARLAEQTKGHVTDGAGITDAEAREVLAELDRQGKVPALREVAKLFDKLTQHSRNEAVRGGLITQEEANALAKSEPYYAPLKGWAADGDMQTSPDDAPGGGQAQARNGVPVKTFVAARGRQSLAFNPLFNAIADAQKITERAQRNLAVQPLLTNMISDPAAYEGVAELYTDDKPDLYWTGDRDEETGERVMRPVNMRGDPKYINIKRDGANHYIKPDDTEAGRALREAFDDMSPPQLHWFLQSLSAFTGLMKSLRTRFSPSYLLGTAPFRDIQDALITAAAEEKMPGGAAFGRKLAARTAQYMLPGSGGYVAIRNYLRGGEPTSAAAAEALTYLEQMIDDGGSVGHALIRSAETAADSAVESLERLRAVQAKNPLAMTAEGAKILAKALDDMSQAIDLQPRLATYRAALDAGISRDDAARLALNSSLNLTKRMRGHRGLELIWPFINAGVASVAKNVRLLRSPAYRHALTAMAGMGSAVTGLNLMLGGGGDDDDDGQNNYSDIPEAEKIGNLVVYYGMGADDYLKIPMGFMVGFPAYLGQKLTETAAGITSPGEAATEISSGMVDIVKGFLGSYSPVRGDDVSDVAIPMVLKMPVELWRNEDYWGKPIYNEPFDKDTAPSSVSREDTAAAYKWWAEAVNRLSGGQDGVRGALSYPAEGWRYLVMNLTGGAGNAIKQTVGFTDKGLQGDFALRDVPVLGSKLGKTGEYAPMTKYYEASERLSPLAYAEEHADEDEWARQQAKFPRESDPAVLAAFRDARTALQALGKERKEAIEGLEGAERRAVNDEFRALRNDIYVDFNRVYNAEGGE